MIEVDKVPGVRLVTDPAAQTLDVRAICQAIQDAAADLRAAKDKESEARTLRREAVGTVARALAPYARALRSLGGTT